MNKVMRFILVCAGVALSMSVLSAEREQLIKQGEYLAQVGGCVSCHTVSEHKPLAGGLPLRTPFGTIYSTNITPDTTTGIGDWTFEDFWQALHHGKGQRGKLLYPAFPFTSYTKVTREDALALYTYLQYQPAVKHENRESILGFPYNLRGALHGWRLLYFSAEEFKPQAGQTDEWNRGAYLVQGLGHCNECHTTRNPMGAMNQKQLFAGGTMPVQEWFAPGLSMQTNGDLAGWSNEDMVSLLKTGISSKGSALGPMAEVVHNSTQYMTEQDLTAIAVYLSSIPGPLVKQVTVSKAKDLEQGQKIYNEHCDSCHGVEGQGVAGIYPSLAGNSTVTSLSGTNAVRSVLMGGFVVSTQHNPEPYSMPSFANDFDNAQVAAVVNYIRQSWGNNATAVTAETVKNIRYKPLR